MNILFDTKLVASFLLFLDHEVQKHGSGFINHTGRFFPVTSDIQGRYAYACPFKPLCSDTSITGANVMSGVYVGNNFLTVGVSGLQSIDHANGAVYFTGTQPALVTGRFAIKEFGVHLTNLPETKLLYSTKYLSNARYNQVLSGLSLDTKLSPSLFVKVKETENLGFALGRVDDNNLKVRVIVVADNEFQRMGVCNILKNLNMRSFSLYSKPPFDFRNWTFTGQNYNFETLEAETGHQPWILKSKVLTMPVGDDLTVSDKNMAIVDIEISTLMTHF